MTDMLLEKERREVLHFCRLLQSRQLVKGTGGNVSVLNREKGLVAISPSAVPYETMRVEDVTVIDLEGRHVEGPYAASSEKLMHLGCYRARQDVGAVIHAHALYATVLACMGRDLPPFYYLQAYTGGATKCIPYYTFGSPELAAAVAEHLGQSNALLLGNHGLLTVGATAEQAFGAAELTEYAAELYVHILKAGEPRLLTDAELEATGRRLASYQKQEV